MSRFTYLSLPASLAACLLAGCSIKEPLQREPLESGVLLFDAPTQASSGSVSFLQRETGLIRYATPKTGVAATDIFNNVNSRQLSGRVTSYAEVDGKGFLVLSDADQIEVVNSNTFRSISLLSGLEQPRQVIGVTSLKAFVSCWGGKRAGPTVSVIDIVARQVRSTIPVGAAPEHMVVVNETLFVTHPGEPTAPGRTVSMIHTATDELIGTLEVGDVPESLVYDARANLIYVLCSGKPVTQTPNGLTTAELITIDPVARKVTKRLTIGDRLLPANPVSLSLDPQTSTLYFLWRGQIYKTSPSASTIAVNQPLETRILGTYGFDPSTATLYGGAANRSAKPGIILRFQTNGALRDSISTDAVPTGFYFK